MKIRLLDDQIREFSTSKTVEEIAGTIAISLKKNVVGAQINDQYTVPKNFLITGDAKVSFITKENLAPTVLNNTAAFVVLVSLKTLYPESKLANIDYNPHELEFSANFFLEPRLKLGALSELQNQTQKLLQEPISARTIDLETAKALFANEEYQWEMALQQFQNTGFITIYELASVAVVFNGLLLTGQPNLLKTVELQQLTGAYWLDNSKNPMLQRIHGMVDKSVAELNAKKSLMLERRSTDHRVINQQLNFFGFDLLIGAGLPLWLPNGTVVKEQIKKYLKEKEWEYDYTPIETPVIGTVNLYKISGHWDHYREDMFDPFGGGVNNNEEFVLRPMNCPHHIAVYKQKLRSYKDLPIRFSEHAMQYRYEASGALTGLERVRAMELTDSHIFVRPDQIATEFKAIYKLINEVLKTFNIEIDYLSFSVRDPKDTEKYFADDAMWNQAEAAMEAVLKELSLNYKKILGEAAFYGPKLDIQIKTAQNHEITVSTIQLDFLLARKFGVTYIDKNHQNQHPIIIHRGLIGTYERFIATLLEQMKGVLPLWLAPVQVVIIPVNETVVNYAESIRQKLKQQFIRTEVDGRDERLAYKIRDAQTNKTPYQLVLGAKEQENHTVTYRQYGQTNQVTLQIEEFIKKLQADIDSKK